ncbi:hypothetical protein VP01_2304g1 [Puccinia sorghi]|uniref:Uncharacterized protein n=1 Tax=Puccinia sorghi TaxID=27349 RepID=A0A0L6V7W8_9BASI|nr:hypothetical protein VP01_2304g1 [Puccinia sorghi]
MRTEITYDTQFASFAQEAFKSCLSKVTIEANKKKLQSILQLCAATRQSLQQIVADIYCSCVKNSKVSSEGLTFVNPENPAQLTSLIGFLSLGRQVNSSPDDTTTSQLISSIPGSSVLSLARPDKCHCLSESEIIPVYGVPPQFTHFNNDNTPMNRTRVEMQGTMNGFLGHSMIPFDDHHTCILIEFLQIHHWTYFKRSTMVELLGMGFAPGPAHLLIDGVPFFEHVLKTTPEDPSLGDL